MFKNKKAKKIILIAIGVILISILTILMVMMLTKKNTNEEKVNLRNILNDSLEIKAVINSDKSLKLISFEDKDNTDKVKVWVFSEPVYLGEFNLVKKDNKYYLEGLNDALLEKSLNAGSHRLLVMKDDKSLGYIKIEIDSDKSLKATSLEPANDNTKNNTSETSGAEENNTPDESNSKEEQTNSENTSGNNNKQEEVEQPTIVPEEPKQEEAKCTPKKFKNNYTYVYEDKDTCVRNGDQMDAWNYFRANGIPATIYGCEEIVDECGNTYYGVYYGNTEGERFYY